MWEPAGGAGRAAVERRRDGEVPAGFRAMTPASAGAWHVSVAGHVPVAAGEHPRLLFRRADLPALRAKADTPEGRAIPVIGPRKKHFPTIVPLHPTLHR